MQEKNRDFSILKKRIIEYLDYKHIPKADAYQNAGLTHGILSQPNGINEENLLRFLNHYADINKEWLFTGEGSMLKMKDSGESNSDVILSMQSEIIDLQRELLSLHRELKDIKSKKTFSSDVNIRPVEGELTHGSSSKTQS